MDKGLVAGVDGCRAGWVYVIAAVSGESLSRRAAGVAATFADLLRITSGCAVIAIDIPIGLSDDGPRWADPEARRLLGPGRGSSVFPPPVRAALECTDYRAACDASFAVCGKKLSKQTFGILPKIRDVDALMTPSLQARVFEVHPELAFRALNGDVTLAASKKMLAGRDQRLALLDRVYDELPRLDATYRRRDVAPDDLLDAAVCAWTASRISRGVAQRLPLEPQIDSRGLRMEISY